MVTLRNKVRKEPAAPKPSSPTEMTIPAKCDEKRIASPRINASSSAIPTAATSASDSRMRISGGGAGAVGTVRLFSIDADIFLFHRHETHAVIQRAALHVSLGILLHERQ